MFVKTDLPQHSQNIFYSCIVSMWSINYEIMKKNYEIIEPLLDVIGCNLRSPEMGSERDALSGSHNFCNSIKKTIS
jgi:hypothetical protein